MLQAQGHHVTWTSFLQGHHVTWTSFLQERFESISGSAREFDVILIRMKVTTTIAIPKNLNASILKESM
ncbi:1010_t:CDS:2 [Cetraspora pellucida]|uniref:1010_t:CDS:1 n=1 Tax=Cetraspora pellucida TaxID=1433469 RepID=A0ACA9JYX3_9GLOM|nr:1010_t:CDS:2 [Cetraspora pellucida]